MQSDIVRNRLSGSDAESRAALAVAEALWANDMQDVTDYACRQAARSVIALLEKSQDL